MEELTIYIEKGMPDGFEIVSIAIFEYLCIAIFAYLVY